LDFERVHYDYMRLTSNAFSNSDYIPPKFTCDGEGINPPLEINDVPSNAQSLVLITNDPDAPAGDWIHWILYNLPSDTHIIKAGEKPKGAQEGTTDFGRTGYGGPCPPSGDHRYYFHLYALDIKLKLGGLVRVHHLRTAMEGHIITESILMGRYERK
jgi:Raf kinase inhibitor-like YbhB/YbcL family protein